MKEKLKGQANNTNKKIIKKANTLFFDSGLKLNLLSIKKLNVKLNLIGYITSLESIFCDRCAQV